jgi:hypothetical protein
MALFSRWLRRPQAAEPFTEARVRRAPAGRGIYQLYRDGELMYAGTAVSGIRAELERHRRGEYGALTRGASSFCCQLASDPEDALREYLRSCSAKQYAAEKGIAPRQCSD